jgi:hypothetical protein
VIGTPGNETPGRVYGLAYLLHGGYWTAVNAHDLLPRSTESGCGSRVVLQEEGMDWLEFRPWSRDVERFCRTWLEQASRHRVPSGPPRADQSALMREYAKSCECLLVLAEEDGDPPSTHTRN